MGKSRFFLILFILCSIIGCSDDCVCTDLFAMSTVTVIDSLSQPVDSLLVEVTNTYSRAECNVAQYSGAGFGAGQYVIFHDGLADQIHPNGEDITVVFFRDTTALDTAEYVFGTDNCKCHIQKISGPDTVVIAK